MKPHDAASLLTRIGVLRSRCDLDLLIFFARHPTALLTSEQLANWLGHELKAIAASLDVLQDARLIRREQNPSHAARMYVFHAHGSGGGWLPTLLRLAKTREGRLALIKALSSSATGTRETSPSGARETSPSGDLRDPTPASHVPALSVVSASDGLDRHDPSRPAHRRTRHG